MKNIVKTLKYTKTHEWVKQEENNTVRVGITDYAQNALGEIVFVEPPTLQETVKKGQQIVTLESVKAATDVYAPLSGEIVEINSSLEEKPGLINSSPEKEGWLFCIKFSNAKELEDLLTAEAYQEQISAETH
jgi:glycine cleavage system H protein